jgi:hypothetical protein
MKKTISPEMHSIIDYSFAGLELLIPPAIGMNKKAVNFYRLFAATFGGITALTDTAFGIKKKISFKQHQAADITGLAWLAASTMHGFIRKDKKALYFQLVFLALAAANVVLTDYDNKQEHPDL